MSNFIILILPLLSACSLQHLDAPMPQTHEIWTKPGYSKERTEAEARACGNYSRNVTYEQFGACMREKGFKYNNVRGW
jgi:hypothetical protein